MADPKKKTLTTTSDQNPKPRRSPPILNLEIRHTEKKKKRTLQSKAERFGATDSRSREGRHAHGGAERDRHISGLERHFKLEHGIRIIRIKGLGLFYTGLGPY